MTTILDKALVRRFKSKPPEDPVFLKGIRLDWPSFFEVLEVELPFSAFDVSQAVAVLNASNEESVIFHLFDQIFADHLTQIKNLQEINASYLLQRINDKKTDFFSQSLEAYEKRFTENPKALMHDLILYLAWDRMCVSMIRLFNHPSSDPTFIRGLAQLKACLVESYQHILQDGRTFPGIYRMLEAQFYYQMREEHLQTHSEEHWRLLSQSFPLLQEENVLTDFHYIDHGVLLEDTKVHYFTAEASDRVKLRLVLVNYLMDELQIPFKPKIPNIIFE